MIKFTSYILPVLLMGNFAHADVSVAEIEPEQAYIAVFAPHTKALICPDVSTLIDARSAVFIADVDTIVEHTHDAGCLFVNSGSWGHVKAAHKFNYGRIQFSWLDAIRLDDAVAFKVENPEQEYWGYSFNLRTRLGDKIEPILQEAFE